MQSAFFSEKLKRIIIFCCFVAVSIFALYKISIMLFMYWNHLYIGDEVYTYRAVDWLLDYGKFTHAISAHNATFNPEVPQPFLYMYVVEYVLRLPFQGIARIFGNDRLVQLAAVFYLVIILLVSCRYLTKQENKEKLSVYAIFTLLISFTPFFSAMFFQLRYYSFATMAIFASIIIFSIQYEKPVTILRLLLMAGILCIPVLFHPICLLVSGSMFFVLVLHLWENRREIKKPAIEKKNKRKSLVVFLCVTVVCVIVAVLSWYIYRAASIHIPDISTWFNLSRLNGFIQEIWGQEWQHIVIYAAIIIAILIYYKNLSPFLKSMALCAIGIIFWGAVITFLWTSKFNNDDNTSRYRIIFFVANYLIITVFCISAWNFTKLKVLPKLKKGFLSYCAMVAVGVIALGTAYVATSDIRTLNEYNLIRPVFADYYSNIEDQLSDSGVDDSNVIVLSCSIGKNSAYFQTHHPNMRIINLRPLATIYTASNGFSYGDWGEPWFTNYDGWLTLCNTMQDPDSTYILFNELDFSLLDNDLKSFLIMNSIEGNTIQLVRMSDLLIDESRFYAESETSFDYNAISLNTNTLKISGHAYIVGMNSSSTEIFAKIGYKNGTEKYYSLKNSSSEEWSRSLQRSDRDLYMKCKFDGTIMFNRTNQPVTLELIMRNDGYFYSCKGSAVGFYSNKWEGLPLADSNQSAQLKVYPYISENNELFMYGYIMPSDTDEYLVYYMVNRNDGTAEYYLLNGNQNENGMLGSPDQERLMSNAPEGCIKFEQEISNSWSFKNYVNSDIFIIAVPHDNPVGYDPASTLVGYTGKSFRIGFDPLQDYAKSLVDSAMDSKDCFYYYDNLKQTENEIYLSGWAWKPGTSSSQSKVILMAEDQRGKKRYVFLQKEARPDVGAAMNNDLVIYSGFKGTLPLTDLQEGNITLTLYIWNGADVTLCSSTSFDTYSWTKNVKESGDIQYTIDTMQFNASHIDISGWMNPHVECESNFEVYLKAEDQGNTEYYRVANVNMGNPDGKMTDQEGRFKFEGSVDLHNKIGLYNAMKIVVVADGQNAYIAPNDILLDHYIALTANAVEADDNFLLTLDSLSRTEQGVSCAGWALDLNKGADETVLLLTVKGNTNKYSVILDRKARPDVADAYGNEMFIDSGFSKEIVWSDRNDNRLILDFYMIDTYGKCVLLDEIAIEK